MILAVDIGNTNIVIGCIEEEKVYFTHKKKYSSLSKAVKAGTQGQGPVGKS